MKVSITTIGFISLFLLYIFPLLGLAGFVVVGFLLKSKWNKV